MAWHWSQSTTAVSACALRSCTVKIRAGKTSIISVSASHHVSYVKLVHHAFSGVPYFYSWYGGWLIRALHVPTVRWTGQQQAALVTHFLACDGRIRGCRGRGRGGSAHMENLVVLSGYRVISAEELEEASGGCREVGSLDSSDSSPHSPHGFPSQPCIALPFIHSSYSSYGRIEAIAPPSKQETRRS